MSETKELIHKSASIKSIIDKEVECPFPITVIPNNMGINLVSVESIDWEEQEGGQLVRLTINFIPENN